jgi:hypothetical protein
MYWLYLLSALGLALLVYVSRSGPERSLGRSLGFCFPREVHGQPSARRDVAIQRWFGPVANAEPSLGPRLAVTLAVLVIADLAFFLSHLAQHKIRALWEFHKVHHSAEVLFPLTVFRNLQHSHVWLSWGRALEHVFVSPALHQIHNSTGPRHF